jgi:hypothetical protein
MKTVVQSSDTFTLWPQTRVLRSQRETGVVYKHEQQVKGMLISLRKISLCLPFLIFSLFLPFFITSVRFQILKAATMKMAVFWDAVPCSLIETDRRFRHSYCLHHQSG